jgi:DNA polymerase III delta subunit
MTSIAMTEPQLVLFHGDPYRCERALRERDEALRSADRSIERHPRFAEDVDVAALDTELQSAALFALGRHFVIHHSERIRAPRAWISWIERKLPPETYVSLVATSLKATNPVLKAVAKAGRVVSLPSPQSRSAVQAVRSAAAERGVRLSVAATELLARRTGADLLSVAREVEKLRSYAAEDAVPDEAVDALAFSSVEQTAYPFYDRLGERDLAGALRALDELRDDPGRLLGGAIRHLARLTTIRLLIERRITRQEMASLAGLQEWLLRRLIPQAERLQPEEAAATLDLGVRLDVEVKSGGIQALDALLELIFATTLPSATPLPSTPDARG